jgi:hypothetical protein
MCSRTSSRRALAPWNDDLRAHHTRRPDGRERSCARHGHATLSRVTKGSGDVDEPGGVDLCVDAGAAASGEPGRERGAEGVRGCVGEGVRGGDRCGWGYEEGFGGCDLWEGCDAA